MTQQQKSHRETKRAKTYAILEEISTRLVLEKGMSHVTIDEIAAEAGISKRTFFNYFPTKEDAILGPAPTPLTKEHNEQFIAVDHSNLTKAALEVLLDMIFDPVRHTFNSATYTRRHRILEAEPELLRQHFARFHHAQEQVERLIEKYLAAHPNRQRTKATPAAEALIVTGIAVSAIRSAYMLTKATDPIEPHAFKAVARDVLADSTTILQSKA